MISTCRRCGRLYDFRSEEDANDPTRLCRNCYLVDPEPVPAHLLDGETMIFQVPHGNCALTRDHAPIDCIPRAAQEGNESR